MPSDSLITWYDCHADSLVLQYEALTAQAVLGWLEGLLPPTLALILDVGAGSGRDAAWSASLGHDVVAVEPAPGMRTRGQQLHTHPRIRWLDDRLPGLSETSRSGLTFDIILLGAVWMHLPRLAAARAPMQDWWHSAYIDADGILLQRFFEEARASLPGLEQRGDSAPQETVFAALELQRLRRRHDQGVPEWAGVIRLTGVE